VNIRFIATLTESRDEHTRLKEQYMQRLGGIEIYLPPLRERREEILPLAEYFINLRLRETNRSHDLKLSKEAIEALNNFNWPGNVRELRHMVFRAVDACHNTHQIAFRHLPRKIKEYKPEEDEDKARISDTLWEELRAEERVFVSLWFNIIPFLCEAADKEGYINWSRASALLTKNQIPVTKVQVDRKLKSAVIELQRGRNPEELMKVSREELAKTLLWQREQRTRRNSRGA
jgi:transcriptional regulator with AAA-type ATPase domain